MSEIICFLVALFNAKHSPVSGGFIMILCFISGGLSFIGESPDMLISVLIFALITLAIPVSKFSFSKYLLWFCCLGSVGFVVSSFGTNAYTIIAGFALLAASIYCIQMASNYERAERTTSSN